MKMIKTDTSSNMTSSKRYPSVPKKGLRIAAVKRRLKIVHQSSDMKRIFQNFARLTNDLIN